MTYPIKTLSHLPLILKSFRKEKGLTQAAIAERLGITQQSYAYFEANPAAATLERLFLILRMLDVEISLDQAHPTASSVAKPSSEPSTKHIATAKATGQKSSKPPSAVAKSKVKPSSLAKTRHIVAPIRKKESW